MTGYQRRNMIRRASLGVGFTVLLAALALAGVLTPLERRLSDQRTAWCQFDVPPPSDELIHLDIDDSALESIHRWPWPRGIWAQVLDELRLAESRTVGFDVLFSEPQNTPSMDMMATGRSAQTAGTGFAVDSDDALFAQAIAAHGRVLLPSTFNFAHHSQNDHDVLIQLMHNPKWLASFEVYHEAVSAQAQSDSKASDQKPVLDRDSYLVVRRQALFELLAGELRSNKRVEQIFTPADAQHKYFPDLDPAVTSGSLLRLLNQQYEKALAYVRIKPSNFWIYRPLDTLPHADDITPPISELAQFARSTGFVNVIPDSDGVVRGVPTALSYRGTSYGQLGIAMAQLHGQGEGLAAAYDEQGLVFIHDPQHRVIPHDSQGRVLIPWTGVVDDWQSVVGSQHHLAVGYVWEAAQMAQSLNANRRTADRAIYDLYRLALDDAKAKELAKTPFDFEDDHARAQRIVSVLKELTGLGYPDAFKDVDPASLSADEKTILAAMAALGVIPSQNEKLATQLEARRADLQKRLQGKAVLIGFTASGLGDVITTPLHTRCPGVIAHGAIFNAIMTNSFWREAGWETTLPTILLMGIIGTLLAVLLTPAISATAVAITLLAYALLNGLVIFDRWNVVLDLSGPLLAGGVSWAGCTFMGLILERRERARITRRFQNYVDPTLVNYVLENPDKARLEGEARTMSVVFTDLEGFTKLSSTIHERVVPVINRYLEQMIPPIHDNNGYVNKFLGDGIMFFFGAPRENQSHAADAINAIMQMQNRMGPFNEYLKADGLPALRMRVGMTTGRMIVGDAGSLKRSDYTVMGDQVNFAARLESANKATGTSILINDATAEAVQEHYLLRPIGRLQVVGRSEAVMCFEPLCPLSQAGHPRRKLVQMSHDLIQAYTEKRWDDCLAIAKEVVAHDPDSQTLVDLYRLNIQKQQNEPTADFDGRIELTSK